MKEDLSRIDLVESFLKKSFLNLNCVVLKEESTNLGKRFLFEVKSENFKRDLQFYLTSLTFDKDGLINTGKIVQKIDENNSSNLKYKEYDVDRVSLQTELATIIFQNTKAERICEVCSYTDSLVKFLEKKYSETFLDKISVEIKKEDVEGWNVRRVVSIKHGEQVFEISIPTKINGEFIFSTINNVLNKKDKFFIGCKEKIYLRYFKNNHVFFGIKSNKENIEIGIDPVYFEDKECVSETDISKYSKEISKKMYYKFNISESFTRYKIDNFFYYLSLNDLIESEDYVHPEYKEINYLKESEVLNKINLLSKKFINIEFKDIESEEELKNIKYKIDFNYEKIQDLDLYFEELQKLYNNALNIKDLVNDSLILIIEDNIKKINNLILSKKIKYQEQCSIYLLMSQEEINNKLSKIKV